LRYDRISIRRLPSGRFQYRVRDPNAARYEASTFERLPEDVKRDKPGTSAGDRWATAQLARFRLGLATAEPAAIGAVVGAYLQQLGSSRPKARPLSQVYIAEVRRTLEGLAITCPALDLNRPAEAKRLIRAWIFDLKAVGVTKSGQVLRRNLELGPVTRARYLIHAKAMIGWAVAEGVIGRNPIGNLSVPQNDRDLEPVFTLMQVRAVFALHRTDDPVWLWATLMLAAGLRRSEAIGLTWPDVLWPQGLLRVQKGKGSAARLVPLQMDLRFILGPIGGPDAKRPRVGAIVAGDDFSGNRKHEWTAFRRLLRMADIDPDLGINKITGRMDRLHPHSCRHTYGGLMLASGYDSMLLRHAMGHRQADTTGDYSESATMFRAEISDEGWEPGELLLCPDRDSVAVK